MKPSVLKGKSLVARLVVSFLLLFLFTTAVLGSTAFLLARRALEESILDRLQVTSTLEEEALSQWIEDELQDFLTLVELPSLRDLGGDLLTRDKSDPRYHEAYEELSEVAASIVAKNAELEELLILSTSSEILMSTEKAHEGDYRSLDSYFIEGQKGTWVQNVYPSPVTFVPTMTLATPLEDVDGTVYGVAAAHLNLERMDRIILERTGLGTGSESYLVDPFNVFISGSRFGREGFLRGVHSEGIDRALEGEDGAKRYENYDGVPVLGVYRWLEDLEIALLTEVPEDEAFAPARRLAWVIFLFGLLITVVLVVGVQVLARQIARPVLEITEAAVAVAGGDHEARAPIHTEDEVGVLAQTFNQMTEELQKGIEDLKAKNAELERFTYVVSHDLKSPLVTIRGFLGFLERDAMNGDLEKMKTDIERIKGASDTMRRLLEELLELSRIGRLVNPSQEVPLDELVEEAVEMAAGRIRAAGVDVVVEPRLPRVYGDRTRLLEVFQNLIDNAAKFMKDQPSPRIEVGARHQDRRSILCHVKDNGIGIPPQYHEQIFGLFNRLDPSIDGTGIGLALVRRIVEFHGGRIWVESEPGRGSTFYFTLEPPPHDP